MLVALMVVGALVGPAAAASPLPLTSDPVSAPDRLQLGSFGGDSEQQQRKLLPTRAELRSAAGMVAAVERLMAVSTARAAVEPEAEPLHGSVAAAVGAGDVDGDGLADVGVLEIDVQTWKHLSLRAHSGGDGVELWRLELGERATAAFAEDDLNGDGHDDVVVFEVTRYDVLEEDCPEDQWSCNRFLAEFSWQVTVASGRDLSPLWSRTYTGGVDELDSRQTATPPERPQYRYDVRNGWVVPSVVARTDGPAVLLDRVDLSDRTTETDGAVPLLTFARSTTSRSTHQLSVVGGDGTDLAVTDIGPAPGFAFVQAVPDLDGDGADEVLVEEFVQNDVTHACTDLVVTQDCVGDDRAFAHAAAVLDGRTLQRRWTHSADEWYGYTYALGADVNGDGVGDVVHRWFHFGLTAGSDQGWTAVVSGSDGRTLWQTDSYTSYAAVGDIDADGSGDLLRFDNEYVEGGPDRVRLTRVQGSTGAVLLDTSHTYVWGDDYDEFLYVVLAGDVDADGVSDLVVGRHRVPCRDGLCYEAETASSALVESGRGGAVRWTVGPVIGDYNWLRPLGDLNDDGAPEFDWTHHSHPDARTVYHMEVRNGTDGAALWTTDVEAEWAGVAAVGQFDADPGHDLAVVTDHFDGSRIFSRVSAVRGRDGHALWNAAGGG